MPCAKFQIGWGSCYGRKSFTTFELKMSFGGISYTTEPSGLGMFHWRPLWAIFRGNKTLYPASIWCSLGLTLYQPQYMPLLSYACIWSRVNSLGTGRFEWFFRPLSNFESNFINDWGMKLPSGDSDFDLIDDNSTLVQITVWCRQGTIHSELMLTQCYVAILRQ